MLYFHCILTMMLYIKYLTYIYVRYYKYLDDSVICNLDMIFSKKLHFLVSHKVISIHLSYT